MHWADELGGWLCTRYHDVRRVYTEHETFSSDYYSDLHDPAYGPAVGDHRRFLDIFLQQFMLTDPPAHTEIRSLLRGALTPRYLQRWQSVITAAADATVDGINTDADVDVMAELAPLVPVKVIAAMLGVTPEDTERFRYWTDAFVATFNPRSSVLSVISASPQAWSCSTTWRPESNTAGPGRPMTSSRWRAQHPSETKRR